MKFVDNTELKEFDLLLHLHSIGEKIIFNLVTKKHKHYRKLDNLGTRNNCILLSEKYIILSFTIAVDKKPIVKYKKEIIGLDMGIDRLLTLSTGKYYGKQYKRLCLELRSIKQYSREWYKKQSEIKSYVNFSLNNMFAYFKKSNVKQLAFENLKGLKYKLRDRKLSKKTKGLISIWNYGQIIERIKLLCDENSIRYSQVSPFYTSQTCSICNYTNKKNRLTQDAFQCLRCSYEDNADFNASKNIRRRVFKWIKLEPLYKKKDNFDKINCVAVPEVGCNIPLF